MLLVGAVTAAEPQRFLSHPPARPLPKASQRPLDKGPTLFVDPLKGDDANDGAQAKPWKTLGHAVTRLKPGDTLCLRGGTYYEHVTASCAGSAGKPITLRAHPGELVILDGGLREFFESPDKAWEPCPDGVDGEFRSARIYPDLDGKEGGTNVLGHFGDSMIPLQGFRFLSDLRSKNVYWNLKNKVGEDEVGIYCGPGVFYDPKSGRIHVRLAHTTLKGLGDDTYRGETDPRKLPLVIAGLKGGPTLTLRECRHVRLQDLVVRGARTAALEIFDGEHIELDGLTIYGGQSAISVRDTAGLRMVHTACRGIAAPWTFRDSLKYRAIEARIFSASGWSPTGRDNRDFELAYCEFTDSVDGIFLGSVNGVRFHHNFVDNISDDGIFLTAATAYDGTTPGGDVHIYQNLIRRCLTTFAFGVGHGRQRATASGRQTGAGVYIYRNLFDYRRSVMYYHPSGPDAPQELSSKGRLASDHGSPLWEPMHIYQNTIICADIPRYHYGTAGLGNSVAAGTRRRVFNNIVLNTEHVPGNVLPPPAADLEADHNIFWSLVQVAKPQAAQDFFAKFRASKAFDESKKRYAPGWTAHDRFVDPKLARVDADWKATLDVSLQKDSPAIDAGLSLPQDWPDPLRSADAGKPDIGAIPAGGKPWHVGVAGRLTLFGEDKPPAQAIAVEPVKFAERPPRAQPSERKPAAVVQGYPAFDAPIISFALRRQAARVEHFDKSWLDTKEYGKYGVVVITGSLTRAKTEPRQYTKDDLPRVRQFLEEGGTLLLMRVGNEVFATPNGRDFLYGLTGTSPLEREPKIELRRPDHLWVKHLDAKEAHTWMAGRIALPMRTDKGENIIGSEKGSATLYRLPVGKGHLVYVGWELHDSLPAGKKPATVDQEKCFEEQVRVLLNIAADIYP